MNCFHHNPSRRTVFAAALLVGLAAWSAPLSAQRMRIGSSNPTGMRAGPGFSDVLFASGDTAHGVELWHHTSTGATVLKIDEYPGPISSYPTEITRRSAANGNTWFVARTKTTAGAQLGRELVYYPSIKTTVAGRWVKDIRAGAGSSNPSQLTLVGTRLFFTANDGTSGTELWTSLGTSASTVRVKDIRPGAASSFPFGLTSYKNRLYFAATTALGTELWVSNGTSAGTFMLKNIRAGAASSTPGSFAVFNNKLYFAATTNARGRELWRTDGSPLGTVLVADIAGGALSSAPSQLTAGSSLAFTAWSKTYGRELYVLGKIGAPVRLSKLPHGETITQITPSSTGIWFRAYTAAAGYELWRTSPAGGVQLVHNLNPLAKSGFPTNLMPVRNGLLFRANDGTRGEEYWRTDGTTAKLLKDIRTGACGSRPSVLTRVTSGGKTKYLFAAKGNKNGIEFWQTNGSTTTTLVKDIDAKPVLPEMHWSAEGPTISLDVKDGTPSQTGVIILGTSVNRPPVFLGFLRGLLMVNVAGPSAFVFFRTNNRGEFRVSFPAPAPTRAPPVVAQVGVTESTGRLALSVAGSCTESILDLNPGNIPPTNGPKVRGRVCLDDESGEYVFCAERLDLNNSITTAYVGLYQKGPFGDLELLQCVPLGVGDFFLDSGQIEILLPLDIDDAPGRHLELHLFTEPPTPESAVPASLITTSYC
jgi:ELWxxDGT repeat protein